MTYMDQKLKICCSNIAFSACSMAIFLLCRNRVFTANAFRNKQSPFCLTLLHYQNMNGIMHNTAYLKKLGIYLIIQSSLQLLDGKFPTLFDITLKEIVPNNKNYKIDGVKLISPLIFCYIFRLPLMMGAGLGVVANHISANQLQKLKQLLE